VTSEAPSVLVTGASSGIGAATAELLGGRGFRVFGTSRQPENLGSEAPDVHWVAMDIRDEDSVQRGVAEVLRESPRLDALVCCAGYGIFGSVEETSIPDAKEQFETNYFGTLRTLRAVLPGMRAAAHGRIAIVGSLAGRAPIPFQAHYSASKAAIDALTLGLRNELQPLGVKVSLVEPGDINTPFNDRMDWGDSDRSPYGARIQSCEAVIRESLPKAPPPEVVARAVFHALTARRPRVRYAVGAESMLVPIAKRLLPDWLSLHLIRSHFGI
jgi:NAD(P)-dependent dehydrogenase (short-subunit alcohol dehydrogenase family)